MNDRPTSTSRASPRRRAASAATTPRARLIRPVTRTSQKWEGWCSHRPSTSGQPSRTRRPQQRGGQERSDAQHARNLTEPVTMRSGTARARPSGAGCAGDPPGHLHPRPPRVGAALAPAGATAANSAAYLLPHLAPGMSLLDVGCGPGTITLDLAEVVAPGRVVGLDVVADAAGRRPRQRRGDAARHDDRVRRRRRLRPRPARRLVRRRPRAPGAPAPQRPGGRPAGDAPGMPAGRAGRGARRRLRGDGLVPRLSAARRLAHRLRGRRPRQRRRARSAARHLLAWAHTAGFEDVTSSASTWCYATPEERDWWGGLWADRITQSALAQQALERGLATPELLDELARAWREWAAHPDGWFVVVNGEILARA